jgi:hypothetical protein
MRIRFQRVHLVWIACALILWLALGMPAFEAFQLSGWLTEYGEFDWLELPAWLKMNETAPPAGASLITMTFSKASPRLVALENKNERLVRKTATTLDVEPPGAKNLVETRDEVWAIMRSASTNRYIIRSASEKGEYVTADTESAGATCKKLVLRDAIYDDWIIEPAPGTNTFFIRTTVCRDGEKYYLATNASGKLTMLSGAAIKANDKVAAWEFKAILGPSTPAATTRPPTPAGASPRNIPLTGGGQVEGYVDANGWTLVLQYIHKGGTNPDPKPLTDKLPAWRAATLAEGVDGSTTAASWGHAAPALLQKMNFKDVRFQGSTGAHNRVIHFATDEPSVVRYFKTGKGSIDIAGLKKNITKMAGHTANLPDSATEGWGEQGVNAMTEFPLFQGGTSHWSMKGATSRWEADDWGDTSKNTIHRIWVK